MSKGWEVAIGVQQNDAGWGSQVTATAIPYWFLFVDNETLSNNAVVKERDEKIIPTRLSPIQSASKEQDSPSGEIQWQPRADDSLNMYMACFQKGTFLNGANATAYGGTGGTFVFYPIDKSLAWTGVTFATSAVYPVNVVKYFGAGLTGTGDLYIFQRGIVNRLTLEQDKEADLIARAEMKFLQTLKEGVGGTGFKSQPNAFGSFSNQSQFVDWNATLTVGSVTTYAIERITFEFDNQSEDRRRLGQRGFYQFPFGRFIAMGEFDIELDNMNLFTEGTAGGTLQVRWQTGSIWMQVFCPNVFYKAHSPTVGDTGPVIETIPFRCYPTAFGGTNAVELSVYPGYGSVGPPAQSELWL